MKKIKLHFHGLSEVSEGSNLGVIFLSDESEKYIISVFCDPDIKRQIGLRLTKNIPKSKFLPEVLISMLTEIAPISEYEIFINNIEQGEYKTYIVQKTTLHTFPIRLSDAVLLSIIKDLPLYIREDLIQKQSSLIDVSTSRMTVPINTLDTERLKKELDKAVYRENYRLASYIKEELNKRKHE